MKFSYASTLWQLGITETDLFLHVINCHLNDRAMRMHNRYYHEIWLSSDEDGQQHPSCISLGPTGNAARNLNEPDSKCVWVFWAMSHVEAMQIYYDFLDFGTYRTELPEDFEPYPDAWIKEQQLYLSSLKNRKV